MGCKRESAGTVSCRHGGHRCSTRTKGFRIGWVLVDAGTLGAWIGDAVESLFCVKPIFAQLQWDRRANREMHVFCTSAKAASVPLHGVGGVEISVEQVDGLQTLPLATPHSVSSWTRASTFWISRPLSSTEVHFGWQEGCIRCPHSHVGQGQAVSHHASSRWKWTWWWKCLVQKFVIRGPGQTDDLRRALWWVLSAWKSST